MTFGLRSVGLIMLGAAAVLAALGALWGKRETEVLTVCLGENITIQDYSAEIDRYRRSLPGNVLDGSTGNIEIPFYFLPEKGNKLIPWPTAERLGIVEWSAYRHRRRSKKTEDPDVLCWRRPEMPNGYFCRGDVLSELHRGVVNIEIRP